MLSRNHVESEPGNQRPILMNIEATVAYDPGQVLSDTGTQDSTMVSFLLEAVLTREVCKDGKKVRNVSWSKDHLHFEGWLRLGGRGGIGKASVWQGRGPDQLTQIVWVHACSLTV